MFRIRYFMLDIQYWIHCIEK